MTRSAFLLFGFIVMAGCGTDTAPPDRSYSAPPAAYANAAPDATVEDDLMSLRLATAHFHDFATAKKAGWSAKITSCMSDPTAGGMGFHYGNNALIDGKVRVDQPELLLYEPQKDGQMRLVAVEYIVPLSAWTAAQPPQLFGHEFRVNPAFGIWGLHVWLWDINPSGMFTDWNPRVNCDNTNDIATMAH